ncbi:MAG: FMN-binding protein [bacterium]|nr:FMN-binding protein [bacterium]
MKRTEKILSVAALIIVVFAWLAGGILSKKDIEPFLPLALPGSAELLKVADGVYLSKDKSMAVAIGTASGYGGPMRVAVGMDREGNIKGVAIIDHKETIPFFKKVEAKEFPANLLGKKVDDAFKPGEDVDGVSGATFSLNALLDAVKEGARRAAVSGLNLDVKADVSKPVKFGLPEILLLLLFAAGFALYYKGRKSKARAAVPPAPPKWRKPVRWVLLLTGLVMLGFVYALPLSIININSLLMGYWPDWQNHLYWYLLLLGVLLPLILLGKTPYCDSFCPFGAAQECLKLIGGGKKRFPIKMQFYLRRIQRLLALAVIVTALLMRNPGTANYEVFGTFFNLTGTYIQYGLMALITVAALFTTRPWCNYLCPLRAVSDYIKSLRAWVKPASRQEP